VNGKAMLLGWIGLCWAAQAQTQLVFESQSILASRQVVSGLARGDFDGDGIDDIVSASLKEGVQWWGYEDGTWLGHRVGNTNAIYAHVADLDRDGWWDILTSCPDTNEIIWWRNQGDAGENWSRHVVGSGVDNAHGIAAGDMDSDGHIDVVATSNTQNVIMWWKNSGTDPIQWTPHTLSDGFQGTQSVCLVDMDQDGDLDVVAAAAGANEVAWFRNDGQWTKFSIDSNAMMAQWVTCGDMDSDGLPDVLTANYLANEIVWWRQTRDGDQNITWEEHSVARGFQGALTVEVADMDWDGDLDVLGTAWIGDEVSLWLNQDGAFEKMEIMNAFIWAWAVVPADVDGDGDMDVVAGGDDLGGPGLPTQLTCFKNQLSEGFERNFECIIPHFTFKNGLWDTALSLANPNSEASNLLVTAYGEFGEVSTVQALSIPPEGGVTGGLHEVLPGLTASSGWLKIESSHPLSGLLTFTFRSTMATTSLPVMEEGGTRMVFPKVVNDENWKTGFAVNNLGSSSISVTAQATLPTGQVVGEETVVIEPHRRWVAMTLDIFPDLPVNAIMHLVSDGEMAGFALSFQEGNQMMFAVPALMVDQ